MKLSFLPTSLDNMRRQGGEWTVPNVTADQFYCLQRHARNNRFKFRMKFVLASNTLIIVFPTEKHGAVTSIIEGAAYALNQLRGQMNKPIICGGSADILKNVGPGAQADRRYRINTREDTSPNLVVEHHLGSSDAIPLFIQSGIEYITNTDGVLSVLLLKCYPTGEMVIVEIRRNGLHENVPPLPAAPGLTNTPVGANYTFHNLVSFGSESPHPDTVSAWQDLTGLMFRGVGFTDYTVAGCPACPPCDGFGIVFYQYAIPRQLLMIEDLSGLRLHSSAGIAGDLVFDLHMIQDTANML